MSGEKNPFLSVGITRFVLMLKKIWNNHFQPKRRYKMVASRQVEILFSRNDGQQPGRLFVAFAQFNGRTGTQFLPECVFPAAKRVGADLLEFDAPKIAEVVGLSKIVKTAAMSVGRQIVKIQLGSGSRTEEAPM